MFVDFAHPFGNLGEGVSLSNVIGDYDTVGTLIIAAGNSLESFLTSGIPNLKLYGLSIDVNCSNLEVYTDGWHEIVVENVILIRKKDMNILVELDLQQI